MKKFIITESEKERILNMHRNAIKRQYLKEQDTNFGPEFEKANIRSMAADETVTKDSGVGTSMAIAINDINGNQLYYTCITDPRLSKKELDANPQVYTAGSLYDADFKNVKNNTILSGDWENLAKKNCKAQYTFVNSWRNENCPKLNAQTYWNYNNQCSTYLRSQQMQKDQAASAEADAKKAEKEAKIAATQDANTAAAEKARAEGDAVMGANALSFATPFNKLMNELMDLVEGTAESNYAMGTQQDIEAKINQLQEYWNANTKGKFTATNADEKTPYSVGKALRFIPRLIQTAKTKYPSMTATFVK
jgi:hypothetical protein